MAFAALGLIMIFFYFIFKKFYESIISFNFSSHFESCFFLEQFEYMKDGKQIFQEDEALLK